MAFLNDISKPGEKAKLLVNPVLPIPAFSDISKAANDV